MGGPYLSALEILHDKLTFTLLALVGPSCSIFRDLVPGAFHRIDPRSSSTELGICDMLGEGSITGEMSCCLVMLKNRF